MIEVERSEGARTALITFGSFTNPGRSEPSYAFVNTVLRIKKTKKIKFDSYYLRSKSNDWYMSGFSGAESFLDSCEQIAKICAGYDHAIFLGNSMGGYGACVFGIIVQASLILAFSPQTRFDKHFSEKIGEKRWLNEFSAMRQTHPVDNRAVRAVWPAENGTQARVYVGSECPQDVAYANELIGLKKAQIVSVPASGHDLVHDLRATGRLEEIIHGGIMEVEAR